MKRLVPFFAAFLVFVSFGMAIFAHAGEMPPIPLTTKSSEPARVPGDADGDGSVKLQDAAVIARYLAGGWNVTINESAADVNGDHAVDLKDAVLIRRSIAGGWNVTLQ